MIKFVGWLVGDPEILSLDVKAFLFMDDTKYVMREISYTNYSLS